METEYSFSDDDFTLMAKGLGHMLDCDCLTTDELIRAAEILSRMKDMMGEPEIDFEDDPLWNVIEQQWES